jgi:hypothetical protein
MENMRSQVLELEGALKKTKEHHQVVHVQHDEHTIKEHNLKASLHAQREANMIFQRRIRELDEKNHHKD